MVQLQTKALLACREFISLNSLKVSSFCCCSCREAGGSGQTSFSDPQNKWLSQKQNSELTAPRPLSSPATLTTHLQVHLRPSLFLLDSAWVTQPARAQVNTGIHLPSVVETVLLGI